MNIVRHSVIAALVGLGAPMALVAQGAVGFSMTIEGTRQGVFPGAKGGAIAGLRFSYAAMSPRDVG